MYARVCVYVCVRIGVLFAVWVSYCQLICAVCVDPVSLARWLTGLINLALSVGYNFSSCSCPCTKLTFDFHRPPLLPLPLPFSTGFRGAFVSGVVVCMI